MLVIWSIIARYFRVIFRNRMNVLYMIFMPIVFTFIFGVVPNLSNQALKVGIIDEDNSTVSHAVMEQLKHLPNLTLEPLASSQEQAALRDQQLSYIITLPSGLERRALQLQPTTISITPSPNAAGDAQSYESELSLRAAFQKWMVIGSVAAEKSIHSGATSKAIAAAFVRGMNSHVGINVLVHAVEKVVQNGRAQQEMTSGQHALVGFATMFMVYTVFGAIGGIFQEKEQGTWQRMQSSPASRMAIMTGYGLSFFLAGWLQYLILYVCGVYIFRIHIPMNGWMILTLSLYTLAICGIGLCVAGLVKTAQQHSITGSLVAVVTSMLGGAYWPIDLEPLWMQHVAWLVPQNWAMQAFTVITLGSASLSTLLSSLVVLAAFAVVFFSAGMVQLRYSY